MKNGFRGGAERRVFFLVLICLALMGRRRRRLMMMKSIWGSQYKKKEKGSRAEGRGHNGEVDHLFNGV